MARGKPRPVGDGGVLHNSDGVVSAMFSKRVGLIESNEADVPAILEALRIFISSSFQVKLVVKSDS